MRLSRFAIGLILLGYYAGTAHADVKSYCTAYARDAADAALGFAGVGTMAGTNNDQWAAEDARVMEQCLALYGVTQPETKVAQPSGTAKVGEGAAPAAPPPKQAQAPAPQPQHSAPPAAKPKMKLIASAHAPALISTSPSQQGGAGDASGLQPGSAAWNAYCAKKYTSFNPATGTYKSYKGTTRRCVVTRH